MSKNRSVCSILTTSNQDIYVTPPQWQADVKCIMLTNVSSSDTDITLDWYDSINTTYHTILDTVTVKAHSLVQITDAIWLARNDKIRALASSDDSISVTVVVAEHTS